MKPNKEQPLSLSLPTTMTPSARKKLHELIDEIISTNKPKGGVDTTKGNESRLQEFYEAVRASKNPAAYPYLKALLDAGDHGTTLEALGDKVGAHGSALGGISSGVTKKWQRFVSPGNPIVERTYEKHQLTKEALRLIREIPPSP